MNYFVSIFPIPLIVNSSKIIKWKEDFLNVELLPVRIIGIICTLAFYTFYTYDIKLSSFPIVFM